MKEKTQKVESMAHEIAWAVTNAVLDGETEDFDYLTIKQLTTLRDIIEEEAQNVIDDFVSKQI